MSFQFQCSQSRQNDMATYTEIEPLHFAAERGQLEKARELLNSGIKADVKDVHHRTPLMVAARVVSHK